VIAVRGLGKRFADRWIFRGISFEVADGESVALLGPSGSGKSVLLKCVAGLLEPTEGEARLGDRNVGMLFQKNALFDSLTVEENLGFPLRERLGVTGREARERIARALEAVELPGTQALFPDELSGGMQKRLGIARALIVQPRIILYDEPTAGLDPITSKNIAEMIGRLRKRDRSTVLAVTNDVHRALQLGDRVGLLALGELVWGGTPAETERSRDPRIHQFLTGAREGPLTGGGPA
jgi:phospholipid/cholesterol/gamma-HCH transport system ATP-binding protein